jgi:cobalamin biosynthesis Mg chelatase CobN
MRRVLGALLLALLLTPVVGSPQSTTEVERGSILLQSQSGDRRPVPDPTILTTQALREAILALKDVIYTRLEGMDKALQLLQARADRLPAEIDTKVESVKNLLTERFKGIELQFDGIQLQFKERDTRVEQTARDSKTAVDAALQAAKEAVEKQNAASSQAAQKSETAFTKQIDALGDNFRTGTKALEDKIATGQKVSDDKQAAINDRLARIESGLLSQRATQGDQKDSTMLILAIVGTLVGVGGLVFAATTRSHRPPGT